MATPGEERTGRLRRRAGPLVEVLLDEPVAALAFQRVRAAGADLSVVHRAAPTRLTAVDPAGGDPPPAGEAAGLTPQRHLRPLPDGVVAAVVAGLAPAEEPAETVATGLKAVDVFAPVPRRGVVAMLGGHGAGRMAFRLELATRLRARRGAEVTLCFLATSEDAAGVSGMLAGDARLPGDVDGPLRTYWLVSDRAREPATAAVMPGAAAVWYFSPLLAARERFPALDPVRSSSALLRPDVVGAEHVALAARARETLSRAHRLLSDAPFAERAAPGTPEHARRRHTEVVADRLRRLAGDDRLAVLRAGHLEAYLTQWFSSLEDVTGHAGSHVPADRALADVAAILDGAVDDLPAGALEWIGSLDEARPSRLAHEERRFW